MRFYRELANVSAQFAAMARDSTHKQSFNQIAMQWMTFGGVDRGGSERQYTARNLVFSPSLRGEAGAIQNRPMFPGLLHSRDSDLPFRFSPCGQRTAFLGLPSVFLGLLHGTTCGKNGTMTFVCQARSRRELCYGAADARFPFRAGDRFYPAKSFRAEDVPYRGLTDPERRTRQRCRIPRSQG